MAVVVALTSACSFATMRGDRGEPTPACTDTVLPVAADGLTLLSSSAFYIAATRREAGTSIRCGPDADGRIPIDGCGDFSQQLSIGKVLVGAALVSTLVGIERHDSCRTAYELADARRAPGTPAVSRRGARHRWLLAASLVIDALLIDWVVDSARHR